MVVSSHVKLKTHMGPQQPVQPCVLQVSFRDLSEISRGGRGGGNFKFGFGNEVTHPCNGSEIC